MGFFARRLTTISIVYDFNNLGAARLARLDTFSVVNRATKSVFMGKSRQSSTAYSLSLSLSLSLFLSVFLFRRLLLRLFLRPFPFLASGTKREPRRGEKERSGEELTRGVDSLSCSRGPIDPHSSYEKRSLLHAHCSRAHARLWFAFINQSAIH